LERQTNVTTAAERKNWKQVEPKRTRRGGGTINHKMWPSISDKIG